MSDGYVSGLPPKYENLTIETENATEISQSVEMEVSDLPSRDGSGSMDIPRVATESVPGVKREILEGLQPQPKYEIIEAYEKTPTEIIPDVEKEVPSQEEEEGGVTGNVLEVKERVNVVEGKEGGGDVLIVESCEESDEKSSNILEAKKKVPEKQTPEVPNEESTFTQKLRPPNYPPFTNLPSPKNNYGRSSVSLEEMPKFINSSLLRSCRKKKKKKKKMRRKRLSETNLMGDSFESTASDSGENSARMLSGARQKRLLRKQLLYNSKDTRKFCSEEDISRYRTEIIQIEEKSDGGGDQPQEEGEAESIGGLGGGEELDGGRRKINVDTLLSELRVEQALLRQVDPFLRKIPPNGRVNLIDDYLIKVKAITFNLAGAGLEDSDVCTKENMRHFKTIFDDDVHHFYVVGTQENEYSLLKLLSSKGKREEWVKLINDCISLRYIPLATANLFTTHLCVFIRKELKRSISNVEVKLIPCGLLNVLGDKGATCISFHFGRTRFLFINAHLINGHSNGKKRCAQYHRVMNYLGGEDNLLEKYDHVFFLGDLNFRINGNRPIVSKLISLGMIDVLRANDQLNIARTRGKAFSTFSEGELSFLPTYKFEIGTNLYQKRTMVNKALKKSHIPSWTDRILFQTKYDVELLEYGAHFKMLFSDHRPVFARFLVSVDVNALDPPEPEEVFTDTKLEAKQRNKARVL